MLPVYAKVRHTLTPGQSETNQKFERVLDIAGLGFQRPAPGPPKQVPKLDRPEAYDI